MRRYVIKKCIGVIIIIGVYCIENLINSKKYVGQSKQIQTRWQSHRWALLNHVHDNPILQKDWNDYGEDAFVFYVLEECSEDILHDKEMEWVSKLNTINSEFGYNLQGSRKHDIASASEYVESHRECTLRTIKENPEIVQKRGEGVRKAYTENPELREKARERANKQFQNEEFLKRYMTYRTSDEFREKMRQINTGRKTSEETKKKLSIANSKPVMCIETGVIYSGCREASRSLPGNKNIQAAADGTRKTAGGFHWKFV